MRIKNNVAAVLQFFAPQAVVLRRAFTISIAILIAVICDRYYSLCREFLIPLATFFLMQMAVRTNLRHVLQGFFSLICIALVGSLISLLHQTILTNSMLVIIFMISGYIYNSYSLKTRAFSISFVFAMFILLMVSLSSTLSLFSRLHDIVLGGIIAIVCHVVFFPPRADVDFRMGVISILKAYTIYLSSVIDLLLRQPGHSAGTQKIAVEKILQSQQAHFPDWVYETGFNPTLQQGHRHFLVRVEQLGQMVFALHQIARQDINSYLLANFKSSLLNCVAQIKKIIAIVIARLQLENPVTDLVDISEAISQLEETYRKVVEVPLELIDLTPDYIAISAVIYVLKDIRRTLFAMLEALRD
jgi:hypothetical protein